MEAISAVHFGATAAHWFLQPGASRSSAMPGCLVLCKVADSRTFWPLANSVSRNSCRFFPGRTLLSLSGFCYCVSYFCLPVFFPGLQNPRTPTVCFSTRSQSFLHEEAFECPQIMDLPFILCFSICIFKNLGKRIYPQLVVINFASKYDKGKLLMSYSLLCWCMCSKY